MKRNTVKTLLLAAGLIVPFIAGAQDQEQYVMTWRGTEYMNGPNGKIVTRHFTEADFVNEVAANNGLDPKTLVFVYRADKRDTVVAMKSDGTFVADVIQMQYTFTDVSNAPGTSVERLAILNDEAHDIPLGSALGTQTSRFDKNGNLTSFSFHGGLQYAMPETNAVFSGSFSTGKLLKTTPAPTAMNRTVPANPSSHSPPSVPAFREMKHGYASITPSRARS